MEGVEGDVAHVVAVDRDLAGCDVVEAWHELKQGRFAGARDAHERHRFAGLDLEAHAVEEVRHVRGRIGVAEVDVVESEAPLECAVGFECWRLGVGDRVRGIHDLEVAIEGGVRVDEHAEQLAEHAHGARDEHGGHEVGAELAEVHVAVCREVDAEQEAHRGGDLREAIHEHVEAGDGRGLFDLGAAQFVGLMRELFEGRGAAPEGLEHANALNRLFDRGGEVAVLILREARESGELAAEAERKNRDGDGGRDEHEGENPARADEQDDAHDRRHRGGHAHDHAKSDPPPNEVRVAHRAREKLPGAPPVVEFDGHVLDFVVEIRAHVTFDSGRGHEGEHAAKEKKEGFEDAERENGGARGPHGCGGATFNEIGVHEALEHLRNHEAEHRAADRAHETEHETDAYGPNDSPQPDHRMHVRGRGNFVHGPHDFTGDCRFMWAVSLRGSGLFLELGDALIRKAECLRGVALAHAACAQGADGSA